jgi:hypothetical protein
MNIYDNISPNSFYQEMTEDNRFYFPVEEEVPETCNVCYEEESIIEVTTTWNGRECKDTVCMRCYSHPDYQQLIKENHSTIKLINPDKL